MCDRGHLTVQSVVLFVVPTRCFAAGSSADECAADRDGKQVQTPAKGQRRVSSLGRLRLPPPAAVS